MPPLALFLNLDATHASDEEIPEREFNSSRPWALPEPSQGDSSRMSSSEAEVQVKASQKIFDRFLSAIFRNVNVELDWLMIAKRPTLAFLL